MSLFSLDFGGALFVILFRSLFPFVISIVYLSLCVCVSASWKCGWQNRENNGTETKEGDYQIEKKMFNKNNRNKMEWFTFFSRKFTALKRWLVGRSVGRFYLWNVPWLFLLLYFWRLFSVSWTSFLSRIYYLWFWTVTNRREKLDTSKYKRKHKKYRWLFVVIFFSRTDEIYKEAY